MPDIQTTMPVQPQGLMDGADSWGGRGWGGPLVGGLVGFLAGSAVGGGGLFGGRANTNTVVGLTNEALLLQTQNLINESSNRTNDNLCAGFSGVNNGIAGLNLEFCKGFGSLTHQIDLGNCRLETAIHAEGEATRALITQNEIQALRDRNVEQAAVISNLHQTTNIVNALRPYPTPSYLTMPPGIPFGYGANPYGCGCNPCGNHGGW